MIWRDVKVVIFYFSPKIFQSECILILQDILQGVT